MKCLILFWFKPLWVSCFPSQIASICRHGSLDQFDLKSVIFISTTGSGIYPKYELEIFRKIPNMKYLNTVIGSHIAHVRLNITTIWVMKMKISAFRHMGCQKHHLLQQIWKKLIRYWDAQKKKLFKVSHMISHFYKYLLSHRC